MHSNTPDLVPPFAASSPRATSPTSSLPRASAAPPFFDAGQDATCKQMVITVPKPFDHAGGIFAAIEAGLDGIRGGDPQGWSNVRAAILDGFLPRQVSSIQDFISGNPALKTAYEVETGMRLG